MEPWKLGVIALLAAAIVGYGIASNRPESPLTPPSGGTPAPTPRPSKYLGKTLPAWPTIKQWVNTPAPVPLSAYKGSPVFLEVFRSECSHCQDAAPFIGKLHNYFAPRGVKFIGIQSPGNFKDVENPENDWKLVQSWIKEKGYTWPVGFDGQSAWFQGTLYKGNQDGVYYPSMFLIDSTGKVVFFQTGHDDKKALELAVQLDNLAPGKGDLKKRAADLTNFFAPLVGLFTKAQRDSFAADLLPRLK